MWLILLFPILCEAAPYHHDFRQTLKLHKITKHLSTYSKYTKLQLKIRFSKLYLLIFLGCTTTNVCQLPFLLYPLDPVWPSDPVPPPTPLDTDAVETEPTPKAPEPTPVVQPQQSVSNMNEPQICTICLQLRRRKWVLLNQNLNRKHEM